MTLPPLLRLSYWFGLTPAPFSPIADRAVLVFFSLLFVAGVVAGLARLRHGWEKMTRRMLLIVSTRLIILGAFGLLLYAMTYERIYVLGMRFGYVIWLALAAWYVWKTERLIRVEIPAKDQQRAERERLEKWLPKSNRK